jgi:hypothetical protein
MEKERNKITKAEMRRKKNIHIRKKRAKEKRMKNVNEKIQDVGRRKLKWKTT